MASTTKIVAELYKQELHIIREFGAPRELVFAAHINRAIQVKWVGSQG